MTEPGPYPDSRGMPSKDERTWALVAHAGGPAGVLLTAGLLGFAVPLVVWLAKKDESSFVAQQSREALNFQLTLFLLHMSGWVFVLVTLGVGFLLAWAFFLGLAICELILGLVAALQAYGGRPYRYPFTLRMI